MTNLPVVFIHGLWLHASSWKPWQELFRDAGYDPIAPGWPHEPDSVAEARSHPEHVANIGINDTVGHYADIIDGLGTPPVVIGHSFGGLIAEKLLGQDLAAAANFVMHSQAKVATENQTRGPLLLISGTEDHTVPDVVTRSTLKQYRDSAAVTELKQFEGRGHSLTIDHGWKDVADAVLDWLKTNGH